LGTNDVDNGELGRGILDRNRTFRYISPQENFENAGDNQDFLSTRCSRQSRLFFHKLHAERQRNDVLRAVEGGKFDFVLLDTRGREPFANGHIPGAWCAPAEEIDKLIPLLPADKELVTYCWGHD